MAVLQRTLDSSQKESFSFRSDVALTTGETGVLSYVPYPCVLKAANIASFSIEADPNLLLTVSRFIVGAGITTWNLGSTFSLRDFGISGVLSSGISLPVSGSTLNILMQNDVIGYVVGGGATAGAFGVAGCFVVSPIQDVKVFLGLT